MAKISVERAVRSDEYYVYTLSYPVPIVVGAGLAIPTSPEVRPGKYGRVFYVGKGARHRVFQHEFEARDGCECRKCLIIKNIWDNGREVDLNIHVLTPDEDEAYAYERKLMDVIGRDNLANRTPGLHRLDRLPLHIQKRINRLG